MNIKTCDKLWTKKILERAGGKCEKCGKDKYIQAHHIIPRTCWPLRYDLENGVALCVRHHIYWSHKDSLAFNDWIKDIRNLDYLKTNRHRTAKNDYKLIEMFLKQAKL